MVLIRDISSATEDLSLLRIRIYSICSGENHVNYQKSELSTKTAARVIWEWIAFSNGEPRGSKEVDSTGFSSWQNAGFERTVAKTIREFFADFSNRRSD
jgi:hypothetical protein